MRGWTTSGVIVETSAEAFRVADAAKAAGHDVRVVPATLVKTLGVGARGIKTDQRDARTLSEVSCRIDVPSVHVPSEESRELKAMCGNRENLVECRTKLVNNVRGWLRTQLWRTRSGSTSTMPTRIRESAKTNGRELPIHIEETLELIADASSAPIDFVRCAAVNSRVIFSTRACIAASFASAACCFAHASTLP
jgi:transposase